MSGPKEVGCPSSMSSRLSCPHGFEHLASVDGLPITTHVQLEAMANFGCVNPMEIGIEIEQSSSFSYGSSVESARMGLQSSLPGTEQVF